MNKKFYSCDNPSHQGKTNSWLTPMWIINALGRFDLDPCGIKSHNTANKIIELPEDGLKKEWHGRVWLNPPYGKEQQKWLDKMKDHGNGIAIIFSRLETKWIQKFLAGGFYQIEGRISFLKIDGSKSNNAGCGSMLIPFSQDDYNAIIGSGIKGRYFK